MYIKFEVYLRAIFARAIFFLFLPGEKLKNFVERRKETKRNEEKKRERERERERRKKKIRYIYK